MDMASRIATCPVCPGETHRAAWLPWDRHCIAIACEIAEWGNTMVYRQMGNGVCVARIDGGDPGDEQEGAA